jgi:hypothetical protein
METLGHSSISLTMNTYSQVLPVVQRAAAVQMEAVLGADSQSDVAVTAAVSEHVDEDDST